MNASDFQWWCGDYSDTLPCHTGVHGTLVSYTSGSALGIASTQSTATKTSTQPSTLSAYSLAVTDTGAATPAPTQRASNSLPAATNLASTNAAASTQNQSRSNGLPVALGTGIGVPLGIVAIGLVGFLFFRQAKLRDNREPVALSAGREVGANVGAGPDRLELHNAPLPYEMDGHGRWREMPGTPLVPKLL